MKERILVGKDIIPFLTKNILPNDLFVSIGYLNDGALSYGPRSRKKVNVENDKRLTGYLSGKELENSPRFRSRLQSFKDSEKYSQVLAGQRNSAPMDIEGDVHIIKISRTVIRWMQNGRFLSKYHEWGDEEQNIRLRHGFGKAETDYPENDWRRKPEYQGLNASRTKDENRTHTKKYTQSIGQSGLFRDPNDPNKMAFRQFIDLSLADRPEWYFIDEDGTAEKLNNYVLRFLRTEYSVHRVKEAIQEIADDEKEFLADLQQLLDKSKSENEFALENILYMTGTAITPLGEKQPFTWINTTYLYEKYPWLDRNFVNSIVEKFVAFSKEDIEKLSESFISNLKFENSLLEAVNRGIQLALDDIEDFNYNETTSKSKLDVIDAEDQAINIINSLYKKIAQNTYNTDDLKRILTYYKITNIKYYPKVKKELIQITQALSLIDPKNINLNWIDISNITDLTRVFAKLKNLNIDCSEWDTRHVEKFNYCFAFINKSTSIKANNWQFDSAKEFDGMFYMTSKSTNVIINAEHWNSGNVITMKSMFAYCSNQNFLHYATKLDISSCMDFTQMFANSKCEEDLSNWEIPVNAIGVYKDPFAFGSMFDDVQTMYKSWLPKIVNMQDKDPIEEMFKRSLNRFCKETGSTIASKNFEIDTGFYISCDIIYSNGIIGTFIYRINAKLFEANSISFSRGYISSKTLDSLIKKVNKKLKR